jgi:hypothetical protein
MADSTNPVESCEDRICSERVAKLVKSFGLHLPAKEECP